MRNLIILFLLLPFGLYAQTFETFPKGLSVELSADYPMLSWKINEGGTGNGDRKELWIKPGLKICYNFRLYDNFFVKPFVGYITFGGKSKENHFGYIDKIILNALEIGTGLLYKVSSFEFGLGIKWNDHLEMTQQHYGYFDTNFSPRQWEEEDFSYLFKKTSVDLGVRVSYLFIYKLNIFAEYWTSLHDIESDNFSEYIDVRNRIIKFGIGYNL